MGRGRNDEGGSECPRLSGAYGAAWARGLQTGPDGALQAVATLKHFVRRRYFFSSGRAVALPVSLTWQVSPFQDAQTVEDSDGFTRHDISANVSRYMLQDTYFPAFELSIKGGAKGVMCAYNAVRPGR